MVREQDSAVMVYVPAGDFLMGSPAGQGDEEEQPQHTVYLDAFWIDRTEVTNAQYNQCVASGVCTGGNAAPEWAKYPVTDISWNQAQAYCSWAESRLPTEAEWEKAARGTDGRMYPWGEGIDCNRVRYDGEGCSGSVVLPVGSVPAGASPYGALDMAGNVAEWVTDWWDPNYYKISPRENPPGPERSGGLSVDVRVVRGSNPYAFEPNVVNSPDLLRTAWRYWYFPESGSPSIGFRCAQSP